MYVHFRNNSFSIVNFGRAVDRRTPLLSNCITCSFCLGSQLRRLLFQWSSCLCEACILSHFIEFLYYHGLNIHYGTLDFSEVCTWFAVSCTVSWWKVLREFQREGGAAQKSPLPSPSLPPRVSLVHRFAKHSAFNASVPSGVALRGPRPITSFSALSAFDWLAYVFIALHFVGISSRHNMFTL